jgi:hypothetical protein
MCLIRVKVDTQPIPATSLPLHHAAGRKGNIVGMYLELGGVNLGLTQ